MKVFHLKDKAKTKSSKAKKVCLKENPQKIPCKVDEKKFEGMISTLKMNKSELQALLRG